MKYTKARSAVKTLLALFITLTLNSVTSLKTHQGKGNIYRRLKLSMINLKKKSHKQKDPDRKLFADLIAKAIQDSGIKAYPEFKYKNIIGGSMNIILPKSRPFMVYNTYPITQQKVDSNNSYPNIPMLQNAPSINV